MVGCNVRHVRAESRTEAVCLLAACTWLGKLVRLCGLALLACVSRATSTTRIITSARRLWFFFTRTVARREQTARPFGAFVRARKITGGLMKPFGFSSAAINHARVSSAHAFAWLCPLFCPPDWSGIHYHIRWHTAVGRTTLPLMEPPDKKLVDRTP